MIRPCHPSSGCIHGDLHKPSEKECGIQYSLCCVNLPSVKTWMEGT